MKDEIRPMRCHHFASLYWHEGEWEKTGPQTATAWAPIGFDAPKNARASRSGDRVTFYGPDGNGKLGDVAIHTFGASEGCMLFLGNRDAGNWYEIYASATVYREHAGHWSIQWLLAKNTRIARAMNAVMVAWSQDQGIPTPTIAELARGVIAENMQQSIMSTITPGR